MNLEFQMLPELLREDLTLSGAEIQKVNGRMGLVAAEIALFSSKLIAQKKIKLLYSGCPKIDKVCDRVGSQKQVHRCHELYEWGICEIFVGPDRGQ